MDDWRITMPEKSARTLDLHAAGNTIDPSDVLRVTTYVSTGTDQQTRPGVDFDLYMVQPCWMPAGNGGFRVPFGVVRRDDIRKLRNLLTEFLLDYPESEG